RARTPWPAGTVPRGFAATDVHRGPSPAALPGGSDGRAGGRQRFRFRTHGRAAHADAADGDPAAGRGRALPWREGGRITPGRAALDPGQRRVAQRRVQWSGRGADPAVAPVRRHRRRAADTVYGYRAVSRASVTGIRTGRRTAGGGRRGR